MAYSYSPETLEFFEDVEKLVTERYYQLEEQSRMTGQTMSRDFIAHLVRVEIRHELEDLTADTTAPHPRANISEVGI